VSAVFRSRANRLLLAAATLCAVVLLVAVLAGGSGGSGGSGDGRGRPRGAAAKPGRGDVRPAGRARAGRLTDDQAIERVRRITPWVTQGYTRKKLVALTFDDGPGPVTPALLAELRRMHVPATFFQVAQAVNERPDVARREHKRPFAVGSHTASHANLPRIGASGQRSEITGGAKTVDQNSGSYPRMFRPPYGEWDDRTIDELKRHRMLMVLWSVTSRDWTAPGTDAIAEKVIQEVRPGGIVLLHDFGGLTREPTLHAIPRIVHALRRKGYRFVTVPEMMRKAPPRHRPPRPPAPYPA
jgi:peptidoglycan/xylan/chitin deacetylase (PgdA/CDA1 family)